MPKIEVSFKSTSRELKLFSEVNSREKSERSDFVKDAIEYYLNYLERQKINSK